MGAKLPQFCTFYAEKKEDNFWWKRNNFIGRCYVRSVGAYCRYALHLLGSRAPRSDLRLCIFFVVHRADIASAVRSARCICIRSSRYRATPRRLQQGGRHFGDLRVGTKCDVTARHVILYIPTSAGVTRCFNWSVMVDGGYARSTTHEQLLPSICFFSPRFLKIPRGKARLRVSFGSLVSRSWMPLHCKLRVTLLDTLLT